MADPTYPTTLPVWLHDGHAFEAVPFTNDTRPERGEDRIRQVFRSAPQIAIVSALYTQDEYDDWCEFFEDTLQVGARWFIAPMKSQTANELVYWRAMIVGQPTEDVLHLGRYRISLRLLVIPAPCRQAEVYLIDLDANENAGLTSSVGITLNGLDPGATYFVSQPSGRLYGGWSKWPTDSDMEAGGLPWDCSFAVTADGSDTHYLPTRYASAAAALAAAQGAGPIEITGSAQYVFWLYDDVLLNRGGCSLLVYRPGACDEDYEYANETGNVYTPDGTDTYIVDPY